MKNAVFKISGKSITFPSAPLASQSVGQKAGGKCGWSLEVRPGGWVVVQSPDGKRQRLMVSEVRGKLSVSVGGRLYWGELQPDRKHLGDGHSSSDADLIAQFPGKVRKILVREGELVVRGQPLLLVEAMKMEFSIKAPFDSKVEKVLVSEGQQLSPGDRFVNLEETQREK